MLDANITYLLTWDLPKFDINDDNDVVIDIPYGQVSERLSSDGVG